MPNQSTRTPQNPAIREVTLTDWHAYVIQCTGRELHPFGTFSTPFFYLSDAEQFRDGMSNRYPDHEFRIFKTHMSFWDESDCYFTAPLDSFSNIFERNWIAAHRAHIASTIEETPTAEQDAAQARIGLESCCNLVVQQAAPTRIGLVHQAGNQVPQQATQVDSILSNGGINS